MKKVKKIIESSKTKSQIIKEATTSADVGANSFVQHDFLIQLHPLISQYGNYKCDYDKEGNCLNIKFEKKIEKDQAFSLSEKLLSSFKLISGVKFNEDSDSIKLELN